MAEIKKIKTFTLILVYLQQANIGQYIGLDDLSLYNNECSKKAKQKLPGCNSSSLSICIAHIAK